MIRRFCKIKELIITLLLSLIAGTVLILHTTSFNQLKSEYIISHHEKTGSFVCSCNREKIDFLQVCNLNVTFTLSKVTNSQDFFSKGATGTNF